MKGVILSFLTLNFSDIVENNVDSVAENAALQRGTVQVEAVHVVLRGVIVKNGQITGNCKRNMESLSPKWISLSLFW